MSASNRKNLIVLFFTMAVSTLGFGMVFPVIPYYIQRMGASGSQLGLLIASYGVMQLIFAPWWGSLSDRLGRKPILLVGILGNGLTLLLFGLSTELWMLFVARAGSGLLSSAMGPAAMAYIGDSTSREKRGGGMGVIGAAAGLGMVVGPGLGGLLATESLSTPFFVGAGLSFVSLLLILLLLPETLPRASRRPAAAAALPTGKEGSRWTALRPLGVVLFLAFLVNLGLGGFHGIFGLYALEKFAYGPEQVGSILMVVGLVSAVTQGLLAGRFTERWGEVPLVRVAFAGSAAGFAVMVLAGPNLALLMATGFLALGLAMLTPAVTALASKRATTAQGIAMGWTNAAMSRGRIVGPAAAGFLFDLGVGLPYFASAGAMLVGFLVSLVWLARERVKYIGLQAANPGRPETEPGPCGSIRG